MKGVTVSVPERLSWRDLKKLLPVRALGSQELRAIAPYHEPSVVALAVRLSAVG